MSVYKYKMQGILDIKGKLEEQAKQEFSVCAGRLMEEQRILEDLYKQRDDIFAEGVRLRNTAIDVLKIKENKLAAENNEALIEKQMIEIKRAEKDLEVARYKMMQARTQTRTYEKLKENDFEEFMHEEGLRESKEIDELNSYRSAFKAMSKGTD